MAEINSIRGLGALDGQQRLNPADLDPREKFSRLLEKAQPGTEGADSLRSAPENSPGGKVRIDKTDKLYEQCLALETFLIKNLLSGMRKNVMKSDLLDTGYAGEIYEDMLWDEYAKVYAGEAGFGLAETAYLELTGQRGKQFINHTV
jgi:flagellar protein FlgJ